MLHKCHTAYGSILSGRQNYPYGYLMGPLGLYSYRFGWCGLPPYLQNKKITFHSHYVARTHQRCLWYKCDSLSHKKSQSNVITNVTTNVTKSDDFDYTLKFPIL